MWIHQGHQWRPLSGRRAVRALHYLQHCQFSKGKAAARERPDRLLVNGETVNLTGFAMRRLKP